MYIPEGFAQVNFHFIGAGIQNEAQVTLGVDNTAADATATALAATFVAQFNAHLRSQMCQNVTLDRVSVKLGPPDIGPSAEAPAASVGTGGNGHFNPNTSALVRKITSRGGRTGRGRSYWPFPGEDVIENGGILSAAYRATLQAALDDFRDVFDDAEQELVLLHTDPAIIPTGISAFVVDARVGTQRRRLRR